MRRALLLASLGVVGMAQADVSSTVPTADPNPTAARVIWLDKQTNTRTPLVLNVGQGQTLGTLSVQMQRCITNLNGQANTDSAWLTVSEPGRSADWFAGWMINTLPEVATLDHPRYDLMLVGCGSKARPKSGRVARSVEGAVAGSDSETVSAGVSGTDPDPFYVPGVGPAESPATQAPAEQPATETPKETPATPSIAEPEAEAPTPAPAEPDPTAQPADGEQKDLHQLMDGVY